MQIAIVHYHLNRGGVTQVIGNHLRALSESRSTGDVLRVAIYFGGRKQDWPVEMVNQLPGIDVQLCEVPGLDYETRVRSRSRELARDFVSAMQRMGQTAEDTVVHIHNHTLGKNVSLPGAVAHLTRAGFGFLLQIHDFAEDFRPANYRHLVTALTPDDPRRLSELLYVQGNAVHYAVLNGRDCNVLSRAGVPGDHLHLLPNPVCDIGPLPDRSAARSRLERGFGLGVDTPLLLYPVRGIRRKNVGELLLWAAAGAGSVHCAVTLPPLNPVEKPRYAAWKQLARELHLPLLFDVGGAQGLSYGENLAAADAAVTTSVAEGFGMVFLETWLAGLPLIGRDLPEITRDFVASGVQLDSLSDAIQIPLDWIGREAFEQDLWESFRIVLDAYDAPIPDVDQVSRMNSSLVSDGLLDFARCSARLQALVVTLVARDGIRRKQLLEWNPALRAGLSITPKTSPPDQRVLRNAESVRQVYSLASSGQRLRRLYQKVLESPRDEPYALEHASTILDAFLSLARFNPVRIE